LTIAYGTAVADGLIGVTVIAFKIYSYIPGKVIQHTKNLLKISVLILGDMAVGIAARLL
jgi:hypothetical protein